MSVNDNSIHIKNLFRETIDESSVDVLVYKAQDEPKAERMAVGAQHGDIHKRCSDHEAHLHASISGRAYSWSPAHGEDDLLSGGYQRDLYL